MGVEPKIAPKTRKTHPHHAEKIKKPTLIHTIT
jgi:hypothetical protein